MKGARGWLLFGLVIFGLFNAQADHQAVRQVSAELTQGRLPTTGSGILLALRAYLNNEGDLRRYFAYANAALGRPYASYYVRSAAEWRRSFAQNEDPDPDTFPLRRPMAPLRPYRDYLVEYPPGFFLVALPVARLSGGSFERFQLLFASTMGLLLAMAVAVCQRLPSQRPTATTQLAGWSGLGLLLLGVMCSHRYDAAVALLVAGLCWAGVRRRPALFGLLLGLAVATKLTPLLCALPWLLGWLYHRRYRELTVALATALGSLAVVVLPWLLSAGWSLLDLLAYHRDRPLQIESSAGALFALLGGRAVSQVYTFGSYNLVGPHLATVLSLTSVVTVGGLLGLAGTIWHRLAGLDAAERRAGGEAELLIGATLAALIVLMVGGKVFSPQYLVWLLPLAVYLSVGDRLALGLLLAVCGLTQLVYPILYGLLMELWPAVLLLALLRNGLLIAWGLYILRRRRR